MLDGCNAPVKFKEQFDLIMTHEVYHNLPQPNKLLDVAHMMLKKGGRFLLHEVETYESLSANKNVLGQ